MVAKHDNIMPGCVGKTDLIKRSDSVSGSEDFLPGFPDSSDSTGLGGERAYPDDIPELYGRNFNTDIIEVTVGKEKREFGVHKGLLRNSCKFFDNAIRDNVESRLHLDDVDPDVFGLFLEWLYTGNLPRNPHTSDTSAINAMGLLPSSYEHGWDQRVRLPTETIDSIDRFINISTQPAYRQVSPDELRFMETNCGVKEHVADYMRFLHKSGHGNFLDAAKSLSRIKDELLVVRFKLEQHQPEFVPLSLPAARTELHLVILLKLSIWAEVKLLPNLYETAAELYCRGELSQKRTQPVLRHLELVYEGCARDSPLLLFMADYAWSTCNEHNSRSKLLDTCIRHRHLLEDLMKRDDDLSLVTRLAGYKS